MNQYRAHVEKKLERIMDTYPNVILAGPEEEILKLLDKGLFANEFRKMYRTITCGKTCEDCGKSSEKGNELERCHTRPRPEIAMQAIRLSKGLMGTYSSRAIMANYIRLHVNLPIRILCPACHRVFDSEAATVHYQVQYHEADSSSGTTESSGTSRTLE